MECWTRIISKALLEELDIFFRTRLNTHNINWSIAADSWLKHSSFKKKKKTSHSNIQNSPLKTYCCTLTVHALSSLQNTIVFPGGIYDDQEANEINHHGDHQHDDNNVLSEYKNIPWVFFSVTWIIIASRRLTWWPIRNQTKITTPSNGKLNAFEMFTAFYPMVNVIYIYIPSGFP